MSCPGFSSEYPLLSFSLLHPLISIKSPNQIKKPLPFPVISEFAYAVKEQFFKHSASHSLVLILLFNQNSCKSGNFTCASFIKPFFLWQSNAVLLTHPPYQMSCFHSSVDLWMKPSKHSQIDAL